MEAKDTVMSDDLIKDMFRCEIAEPVNWMEEWLISFDTELRMVAQAQAEISFKAGYEQALGEAIPIDLTDIYDNGHQAGMKEVVEWVGSNILMTDKRFEMLQAQKEEWGIK